MRITDELRAWARDNTVQGEVLTTLPAQHPIRGTLESLVSIADRIDAEHERKVGYMADEWDYWESTHIELPKEADGEYIYVGEKLDGYGKTIEVVELRYGRSGWVLISRDGNAYADTFAFTHHHAPTVEDVLREFGRGWHERMVGPETFDIADYVERYAAKLRLAGDAE